jgi:hypothetical protein
MKRILIAVAVGAAAMTIVGLVYIASIDRRPGHVDAARILVAAQTYAHDLKTKGLAVPPATTLEELIARGLLSPADVSGFNGMEVTVSLSVDPSRPQDILMRARLRDGHEMIALADGSVRVMTK